MPKGNWSEQQCVVAILMHECFGFCLPVLMSQTLDAESKKCMGLVVQAELESKLW
jgi:hypothetical protein